MVISKTLPPSLPPYFSPSFLLSTFLFLPLSTPLSFFLVVVIKPGKGFMTAQLQFAMFRNYMNECVR